MTVKIDREPILNRQIFATPSDLLDVFEGYLKWVEDNPHKQETLYGSKGMTTDLSLMRMPTIEEFCRHIRCTKTYVAGYASKGALWLEVFEYIKDALYAISISGAASGLLKESIVSKKLGLAEKIEKVSEERRIVIMHTPDNGRAIELLE